MIDLELLEAYGLGDCFGMITHKVNGPIAVARIVATAKEVWTKVKAPKTTTDTVKVDGPYVSSAKADEKAKATAEAYLHAVAIDVLEKFSDQGNVLYWLRNLDTLSGVLKSEVEWWTYAADKTAPRETSIEDEKAALAADYRGLKAQAELFFGMIPAPDTVKWEPNTVRKAEKSGHLEVNLDVLHGNYGSSEGTVATGKYAPVWDCLYVIDGYETGDPKEAIRYIWPGTNRVGISTGDLFRIIDGEPWTKLKNGETIKFKAEGNRVEFLVRRKDRA